jgi:hypothetical protein
MIKTSWMFIACLTISLTFGACLDSFDDLPGDESPCNGDNTIEIDGEDFCIVIEEGFLVSDCPEELPVGTEVEDLVVCSEAEPPEDIDEELRERGFLPKINRCPDPDDPNVTYVSEDTAVCDMLGGSCEPGTEAFDNECGCGCIAQETECPDPDDPNVTYVSEDTAVCDMLGVSCEPGTEAFDNECGCGCIAPANDCPDPDEPNVSYISDDPEECAMIGFECERGAEAFDDDCGCGCITEP